MNDKLNKLQEGARQIMLSHLRCAFGDTFSVHHFQVDELSFVINVSRFGMLTDILVVIEGPVQSRLSPQDDNSAVWRHALDPKIHNAVVVMYGLASEPGALYETSIGNTWKDDYRRLALGHEVREAKMPGTFCEIKTPLNEQTLKYMILRKPVPY